MERDDSISLSSLSILPASLILWWVLTRLRVLGLSILTRLWVLPRLLVLWGLGRILWRETARSAACHLSQLVKFALHRPFTEGEHDDNNQVHNGNEQQKTARPAVASF